MSDGHFSALERDEAAAGLPVRTHDCAECAAAVAALRAQANAVRAMPAFTERLLAVDSKRTVRALASRWSVFVGAAIAASLTWLAVWIQPAEQEQLGLKGAPTIELLHEGQPVTHAHVGAVLEVAVGGAGRKHVRVLANDAELIPETAVRSGARVRLGTFTVTPGDVTLRARFDDGSEADVKLEVEP